LSADFDEPDFRRRADFPPMVRIAGIVWIIFGCLIVLNAILSVVVAVASSAQKETATTGTPAGASAAGNVCGGVCLVLFGAVFIHVGLQSIRGTAKDTLGNGIGSIVLGLLNLGWGVLILVGAAVVGGAARAVGLIVGVIGILGGLGLLAAGVLALVGRVDYRAWRQAHMGRRKRRQA
jgi:hypothetical protein